MTRFTFSSARGLADSVLEWFQGVQQSGFEKTTRAQLALTRPLSRELIRNSVRTYRLCWQRLSESVETTKELGDPKRDTRQKQQQPMGNR